MAKGAKAGEKNIGKERAIKLTATNKDEKKKRRCARRTTPYPERGSFGTESGEDKRVREAADNEGGSEGAGERVNRPESENRRRHSPRMSVDATSVSRWVTAAAVAVLVVVVVVVVMMVVVMMMEMFLLRASHPTLSAPRPAAALTKATRKLVRRTI